MTGRLTEVVVDCHDARSLAEFWCEVLDYHLVDDSSEWIEIAPWEADKTPPVEELRRAARPPSLLFLPVPDEKQVKNRLHLDISPIDRTQSEEVERVLALGARRVDIGQGEQSWVVLADPEGNEFCILRSLAPETGS
jgi:Glyoxalase-like domain